MTTRMLLLAGALLASTPRAVQAQVSTTSPLASQREMALERREAMRGRRDMRQAMSVDDRAAKFARREARISAMPADQQQFVRESRSYQQSLKQKSRELRQEVKAGRLTPDDVADQLQAYRAANKPVRPSGMPVRKRAP